MPPEPVQVLLDENIPYEVGARLRLRLRLPSEKIDHVHDLGFASRSDEFLYAWAEQRHAVIVTFDEDFADQRRFPLGGHCGVVRLRVEPTTEEKACEALDRLLRRFDLPGLVGRLAIVDESRIRLIGGDLPPLPNVPLA